VGNRKSQTLNGTPITYTYDAADRLTNAGGVAFTWDDNGNLLSDGVRSYSYDFANRLTEVSGQGASFSFGYDGLDHRYQQTVNAQTTTYLLDQAASLSQVLSDGQASYYYGLGRISQQKNGISEYFLTNALGSVRQLAGQDGSVSFEQTFDPFGNPIRQSGQGGSPYGYAGEWTDSSGLQYLRARYYAPSQGRFLTKDPFPGTLTQPTSLTPYTYALNNPVLYTDPSGQFIPILAIAGIGFAAGAIYDAYRQTNGFTNFCHYDIVETLAWGVGGAAAATTATIMAVSGVGLVGMGLQGTALGLSGLGISGSVSTSIFIAGSSAVGWSSTTIALLFSNISLNPPAIKPGSVGGPSAGEPFSESIREKAFKENPQKTCVYCRQPGTATQVDHVIPKSLGGNATLDNAQLTCPHCNQSKGNRLFPLTPPPGYLGPWPPSWWKQ
jgi:RHS repeat-associated protein